MAPKQLNPLANEESLARRIAYERERRHWSPGGLARLMSKAGCPMNQSAIWKIEHGTPRRKITVDEAVTFAKVFDTTLEELLTPPELVTETAVLELLSKYEERYAVAETALAACDEIAVELDELLSRHPEALDALAEAVSKTLPIPADEAGDLRDLKRDVDLFIASRRSSEEQAVAPDRGEPATVYWLSDLFGMAHQRPSNSDDTEGNNGEHQAAT